MLVKQLGWAWPGQDNDSSHQGPWGELVSEIGSGTVLVPSLPLPRGTLDHTVVKATTWACSRAAGIRNMN